MKKYLLNNKLFILLAFSLSFIANVNAQTFQISDIRVEGLQRVSASPVFAALPLEQGDTASPAALRAAIQALFQTGFFDDVQVLQDGTVLVVRVKERPTISEITIDGNKAIKTEALEEAMAANELAAGQIFQRSTLDGILNELERQYVSQGRYAAEVKGNVIDLPNNQVKVEVLVDEGEVASIKHINIVGNEVFSSEELSELFELNTSGWLSWLTSDDRYAREKLVGDIENLESFYLDRGYLDFRVVSSQVSLSPDQKSIFITLNIEEGEVYTVDKIELAGDLIVSENSIRRLVLLSEGKTFSQGLMTATSEYITTLMGNAGYTNAEVEGIPETNPEDNTVNVTFLVNPSSRVYVRRVEFRGNTQTQDEVLRREMRQMESAPASNARISQGRVRLERLGFFKGVDVENKDVPGTDDLIDVEYTVEEQPTASINAHVGYGQGTGLMVGGALQHNNWQGSGKQVGVSVNHSTYQTAYEFSYLDPYYTPDGVSRGISVHYRKRDYSKIRVASFTTDSYGVDLRFGYPISEVSRLNFSIGYNHMSVKTGSQTVQEIRTTPFELDLTENSLMYITPSDLEEGELALRRALSSGFVEDYSHETGLITADMLPERDGFVDRHGSDFDNLNVRFSWLRSTLNRGMMATRGSRQTIALDVTVPGSDLQYYTLQYDGQIFAPITDGWTLRFRTSLGYGNGYGDMDDLPFFKNFYAGGFGSVRGFRISSLGPQATPWARFRETVPTDFLAVDSDGDGINDSYQPSGNAYVLCESALQGCIPGELQTAYGQMTRRHRSFGGNVKVEFGADLIFPVPFIEDQRSTQLALFLDVGNVFSTDCGDTQINCGNFDVDELRASVGISLNWLSAMGPLTFSLAKPIRYDSNDERESFQFSLAAPF